ncbi:hypothetical protein VIGAN_02200800, partial [Vigna angularis var. angularis]
ESPACTRWAAAHHESRLEALEKTNRRCTRKKRVVATFLNGVSRSWLGAHSSCHGPKQKHPAGWRRRACFHTKGFTHQKKGVFFSSHQGGGGSTSARMEGYG